MKKISKHEKFLRAVIILCALMTLCGVLCNAQDRKQSKRYVRQGDNFTEIKVSPAKDSTKTAYTFTDSKGKVYPIYLSGKGRAYVGRVSQKTGRYYRQYMPKEIEQTIYEENL